MWYTFERGKAEVGGWKLKIRKKLRRKSAEKMCRAFELFCRRNRGLAAGRRRKERVNRETQRAKKDADRSNERTRLGKNRRGAKNARYRRGAYPAGVQDAV